MNLTGMLLADLYERRYFGIDGMDFRKNSRRFSKSVK